MTAAYALRFHHRWAAGLTYFWGLTLTTQAVVTPYLRSTFPDPVFLLYWAMHIGTVWAAVYLAWGRDIRPDWRSYRIAIATTAAWAAAVFTLNWLIGSNYGYLNAKPRSASILDLLGPWPWYIAAEAAIVAAAWALFTWPWVAGDHRAKAAEASVTRTTPRALPH
ncbi:TIGR02206 family membrane protein [Nocardioides sp. GCM10027113]|uniref:TMEM164-related integral membrane acyltransferase n=1 Tax=unclassified Nocardioides TaxID=2615069 RepID=UPI00361F6CB8